MKNLFIILNLTFLALCWSLFGCSAKAGEYTIEKVIEIGPADWVPWDMPLKWSPDGAKLAYFHDEYLFVADTLGGSRQIVKIDIMPHRYEWLTESQIIISSNPNIGNEPGRMIVIDINRQATETIETYIGRRFPEKACKVIDFEGPLRTIEGNIFYRVVTDRHQSVRFIESPKKASAKSLADSDNHFVRWGSDALYKVKCDRSDSNKIARKPYENMPLNPEISLDGAYIMMGGTMQRLADSVYIVLDTMIKQFPPKTRGCGFILQSFNPVAPELLFQLTCDDGHSYITNAIGTYNYNSYDFIILDPQINLEKCGAPSYAPDGKEIAFLSNHKVFILMRGIK